MQEIYIPGTAHYWVALTLTLRVPTGATASPLARLNIEDLSIIDLAFKTFRYYPLISINPVN